MMTGSSLAEFLQENDFYVNQAVSSVLETVLRNGSRRAFLLQGPAGVGKTQLTYLISRWLNAQYIFYQVSYSSSEEELLYKYIPSEETKSGIKITLGPIPRALIASKTGKVVLVLDEIDKARPSTDALLLDVLQNSRASLYLDEQEQLVEGNPENLIIFMTSNAMRELSEPLMRRVITITLLPLPTPKVFALLSKKFSKEVSLLLAQIYDDTIKAGLRKPATIQELYQLGEILQMGTKVPLEDLLQMFVIKYDDDLERYKQYLSSGYRKPYHFFFSSASSSEEEETDLAEMYKPDSQEINVEANVSEEEQTSSNTTSAVLDALSKITIKAPDKKIPAKELEEEEIEATFKASVSDDAQSYTDVIKALRPQPTESGDNMGKFSVINKSGSLAIIAKEPLTIEEYEKLLSLPNSPFEAYVEGEVFLGNPSDIDLLIEKANKVYYYSKKLIRLHLVNGDVDELVELRLDNDYMPSQPTTLTYSKFKLYSKVTANNSSRTSLFLSLVSPKEVCRREGDYNEASLSLMQKCIEKRVIEWRMNFNNPEQVRIVAEQIAKFAEQKGISADLAIEEGETKLHIYFGWSPSLRIATYR